MARDPAALPDPELPSGDPASSGSGAARSGWLRWVGVAGLCVAIWGGLVLVWPYWEKHRAYEIVAEHFEWDEKEKAATVRKESKGTGPGALREIDRRTARALRVVGTKRLEISGCDGITSLAGLGDLSTLQVLILMDGAGLTSLAGLPPGVEQVYLWSCNGLTNLTGLPQGVRHVGFNACERVTSVAGLPVGVEQVYLWSCNGLTSLAGLPEGVQLLSLWHWTKRGTLAQWPAGLKDLDLQGCRGLQQIANLPEGLKRLAIRDCSQMERVGALPPWLMKVEMANTPKLPEEVKAQIRALVKKNGGEVIE